MVHSTKNYKLKLASLFILFGTVPSLYSIAQNNYDTVKIRPTKISETVYMLEGSGGNIGVCIGKDGTFIIDDQFAPLTKKIKVAIAQLTDKPVQFIVNTHFHGDHTGGNENFGGEGAVIVSHSNTRKRLEAEQLRNLPAPEASSSPAIQGRSAGLPKITFDESVTFHYNGETVDVFYSGFAHTDGDVAIYFKESNVIHMGDVFVRYGFPFIDIRSGGNVNGMIAAIDQVLTKINDNTKIIPGHGKLATKQDMIDFNNMLKTIRDRVKKLMDEGKTVEEIIKADPLNGYEKRGVKPEDFINVVYQSIEKAKS